MNKLSTVAHIVLGALFLISGLIKIGDVGAFVSLVSEYPVPGFAQHLAIFLPPAEVILGLALIFQFNTQRMALASGALLTFFTVFYVYGYATAGISDCGCFGNVPFLDGHPLIVIIRNAVLIGLSYVGWKYEPNALFGKKSEFSRQMITLAIGIVLFTLAGVSSERPLSANFGAEEVSGITAPRLNIEPIVEMADMRPENTYLLYIYSPTCPACWDTMENVKAYKTYGKVDDIIGITSTTADVNRQFVDLFQLNFETYLVDNNIIRGLTNSYPRIYIVRNNRITEQMPYPIVSPHRYRGL